MWKQTREMRRIAWFDMLLSLNANIDAQSIEVDILGISSSLAAPSRVSRAAVVRYQKLQAHSSVLVRIKALEESVGLIEASCRW